MWRDGRWISDDDTMTTTPAAPGPEDMREAAQALHAVAEVAQSDPEYRETLGMTRRQAQHVQGGALALEATAAQL